MPGTCQICPLGTWRLSKCPRVQLGSVQRGFLSSQAMPRAPNLVDLGIWRKLCSCFHPMSPPFLEEKANFLLVNENTVLVAARGLRKDSFQRLEPARLAPGSLRLHPHPVGGDTVSREGWGVEGLAVPIGRQISKRHSPLPVRASSAFHTRLSACPS